jgi:superfamily I DNA and/or RNA helicase
MLVRRFNVAVTRGMALCVVVGKPQLLYADLHWRELLKYCVANGKCISCV